MRGFLIAPVLTLLGALSACSARLPAEYASADGVQVDWCERASSQTLDVQYLGVSGLVLRRGRDVLVTAPMFSNPAVLRVGLRLPIWPNRERIDRLMPEVPEAEAILVGHAHYDHLMDVPHVVATRAPRATVYGSHTMANLIADAVPEGRRSSLNQAAGNWRRPGEWSPVWPGRMRVMALHSAHAAHLPGLQFFRGQVQDQPKRAPVNAYDWKEGQTFTYLIDFLEPDGSVGFRIHFQDAASLAPYGLPPREILDERRVDLAVVCVGGYARVDDYPSAVLRDLQPRHVLLTHWEDFFRSPEREARVLRYHDIRDFVTRVEHAIPSDADWTLLRPMDSVHFRVCE